MNVNILAWIPGPIEWTVIVVVALLIFGRRLPDVARSVGKSIVEFKRGLRDVKDDIETQSRIESPAKPELTDKPASSDDSTVASDSSKDSSSSK